VAFVLLPDLGNTTFRHLDLVRLTPPRVLVVMVSQTGFVTNKVIEVEGELSVEQLQECANYLNGHFSGMTLEAIRQRLLELMGQEKAEYDSLLKKVVELGRQTFAAEGSEGGVLLDGTAHILDKPEFEDLSRMRAIFRTFEEKSRLVQILNACIAGAGMRVLIGHENPAPALQGMTLVSAPYLVEADAHWALGVMGATRMEYARVISLVDHVARAVAELLQGASIERG
jgi:heat-inducible transcriptional repressor